VLNVVTRVLQLVFEPRSTDPDLSAPLRESSAPVIDFVGYTDDCALVGSISLEADRLTDLLNGADEVELVNIGVMSLRTGQLGGVERITLPRSELFAVTAEPPRGNLGRRRPTRQHAVAFGAGRYLLHGHVHTRPGGDPLLDVGRRPSIIPLTGASVRYAFEGERHCDEATVLLVNRDRADWVRIATEAEVARLSTSDALIDAESTPRPWGSMGVS
jgi:hypothetical protein